MKNKIYNENNGLWYELQGDYYIPCLTLPAQENKEIGIFGQRHARYLKQHHKVIYYNLLTKGKLNKYLADINKQAQNMFERLVKELAEEENITEKLKADDMMLWVNKMNDIRSSATEIVNSELIFTV